MKGTILSVLAIALLAISAANLPNTGEAVPTGAASQNGYMVAYRDIVRMLLEKQPIIYEEIMNGQLRPGIQMSNPAASSGECVPMIDKPDLYAMTVKNVASVRANVVANLVGYIEFFGQNSTYLPVELDRVSVNNLDGRGTMVVTLTSKCASFNIKYRTLREKGSIAHQYEFTDLEMIVGDRGRICDFEQVAFAFVQPGDLRYSCRRVLSHECSFRTEPVARLVLRSFELELDGASQTVSGREFSKREWIESCDYWPW